MVSECFRNSFEQAVLFSARLLPMPVYFLILFFGFRSFIDFISLFTRLSPFTFKFFLFKSILINRLDYFSIMSSLGSDQISELSQSASSL